MISSSKRALVSRASHCHQTPQALRPHSGPVTSVQRPNSTASSPADAATRSPASDPLNR